jgi:predicted secreted protein
LIGVYDRSKRKKKLDIVEFDSRGRWDSGIETLNGNEVYFVGIIDILQDYNGRKKAAHFFKSVAFGHVRVVFVPPV